MEAPTSIGSPSKGRFWTAVTLSTLAVLFLVLDGAIKVLKLPPAVQGTVQLGYPQHQVVVIGVVELLCAIVYCIPQTAVLGAILLTAFLGGGVASHVRIESPLFSHSLFPVYVAVLVWGGLYLRDRRLRALIPIRFRRQFNNPL